MTQGPGEWALGGNTFRFEPPDLFWMTFRQTMTLEDAARVVSLYQERLESRPFIFVAELQAMGRFDLEVGRYLSEFLPSEWFLGKIIIGARLLHRAYFKGIALASLLTEHADARAVEKIHYVSSLEQAQVLIARLRSAHSRQEVALPALE